MALPARYMSAEEYLDFERSSTGKHEYFDGQVYAMAGASPIHSTLVGNLYFAIRSKLQPPCQVHSSDLRVRIPESNAYLYPDLVAFCGDGKGQDEAFDTLEDPTSILEVLSPSTERDDRGAKFAHYREIGSLKDYVLVAPGPVLVEHYRRTDASWEFESLTAFDQELVLDSLNLRISLRDIYDHVPANVGLPPISTPDEKR